jgi:hypothetical protein
VQLSELRAVRRSAHSLSSRRISNALPPSAARFPKLSRVVSENVAEVPAVAKVSPDPDKIDVAAHQAAAVTSWSYALVRGTTDAKLASGIGWKAALPLCAQRSSRGCMPAVREGEITYSIFSSCHAWALLN